MESCLFHYLSLLCLISLSLMTILTFLLFKHTTTLHMVYTLCSLVFFYSTFAPFQCLLLASLSLLIYTVKVLLGYLLFHMCCELNCFPSNLYVEALTPCDAVWKWGHWIVIKFRWGHEGPCDGIRAFIRKDTRKLASLFSLHLHASGKDHMRTQQESNCLSISRELSIDTDPAGILLFDFQDPKLWEITFCGLNHSAYGILLCKPELRHCKYSQGVHEDP